MSVHPSSSLAEEGFIRPGEDQFVFERCLIGGSWLPVRGDAYLPVYDSATETRIGNVRSCSRADVDDAVTSAKRALGPWRSLDAGERARHLVAVQSALRERAPEIASVIAAEVGTVARMSMAIQVESSINMLGSLADIVTKESFVDQAGNSKVLLEPVGVVGAITPWNYPLFQTVVKVGAALAAGCTVVHKPSELAPLSSYILAEACERAGLPPGVYNLITGVGATIGEALAGHRQLQMVSFTGSPRAGQRVYELAAGSLSRAALELGGKSASVLLADAPLDQAVKTTVNRAFLNSGQTCDAWTRLLVPAPLLGDALEVAAAQAKKLTVGDPFDERSRLGPLISHLQRERVRGYVEGAVGQGASIVAGGSARFEEYPRGHFFRPTVLSGVEPHMTVAQEEVFGPVLSVMAYDNEQEALEWANGTDYGLSGAVWSADIEHAEAFARQMEAGQIVVNGGRFNPLAPFGGVKRSGLGREMGKFGIREFLESRAIQF